MKRRNVERGLVMDLEDPRNAGYLKVKVLKYPLPIHYQGFLEIKKHAIVEGMDPKSSPFITKIENLT
jgi:hypothetical protein